MKRVLKFVLFFLVFLSLLTLFILLIRNGTLQILSPQGYIAQIQSQILWGALILAAMIGIPVVSIIIFLAFTYREGNSKKRTYTPDWTVNKELEIIWWAIPTLIILCISVILWNSAHAVDPFKPIVSNIKPVSVQVIALRWKWLFIYPAEHIATINVLEFPVNTPVNFQLTADNAPMNSFWIPRLGGQIYAMTGMSTQLHFLATQIGTFQGGAAEINGDGFSGMNFTARSVTNQEYQTWISHMKKVGKKLDSATYNQLTQPSSDNPESFYTVTNNTLYTDTVLKYMQPNVHMKMPGN